MISYHEERLLLGKGLEITHCFYKLEIFYLCLITFKEFKE